MEESEVPFIYDDDLSIARLVRPVGQVAFAIFLGIPHDLQAGQQFHVACRAASLYGPDALSLVDRVVFRPVLAKGIFC
jgi:hypothetical protein